jgi:hypothetical protein
VATIRKSIEVPAARADTAAAWAAFIDSVLIGRRRLACGELTCVDPSSTELVSFDDLADGRTRVNVTLPIEKDEPAATTELLGHKISHDLVLFWDYIETGEYRQAHPPEAVERTAVDEDVRKGRLAQQDTRPAFDQLSVRGSGRS